MSENSTVLPAALETANNWMIRIDGMTCASYVTRVESALASLPGGRHASVSLATESATVQAASDVHPETPAAAVADAGDEVRGTEIELVIEGMACASCTSRIENPSTSPGVLATSVNLARSKLVVKDDLAIPIALVRLFAEIGP